jgi:hypothetical protein
MKEKKYIVTETDFNKCIGDWLNDDNVNYREYVRGIKLFKEFLDEQERK